MHTAVAMPQPSAPSAGTPIGSAPNTSSAVSGTLSASEPSCSAITAFGRDTAVLKPRNAVNSSANGSAKASAPR